MSERVSRVTVTRQCLTARAALPADWVRDIERASGPRDVAPHFPGVYVRRLSRSLGPLRACATRDFSRIYRQRAFVSLVAQVLWSDHFPALGPDLLWGNVQICPADPALAQFDYRLQHNALLTMWQLNRLGFTTSLLCPVCQEVEGLIHMFFGCSQLVEFTVWAEWFNKKKKNGYSRKLSRVGPG